MKNLLYCILVFNFLWPSICIFGQDSGSFKFIKRVIRLNGGAKFEDSYEVWFSGSKALIKMKNDHDVFFLNEVRDYDRGLTILYNKRGTDVRSVPLSSGESTSGGQKIELIDKEELFVKAFDAKGMKYNLSYQSISIEVTTVASEETESKMMWKISGISFEDMEPFLNSKDEIPINIVMEDQVRGATYTYRVSDLVFSTVDQSIFEIPEETEEEKQARLELIEELQLMWEKSNK